VVNFTPRQLYAWKYQYVQWKTGIFCLQSIYCKHGCNVVFRDCRECWTRARRIPHASDAVLELLSAFIHLCTTLTPVTVLNSHTTMKLYRFHAFAKQKCHNTLLLSLSALLQGHRHFVELFPRFLCVPQPCQCHLLVAQGHRLCIPYTQ